ncbi:hypothetical protein KSP35_11030 [Aquihabitans sp. G128]|uniref:SAF domain-containing protein n=1 Tax=Aquihabitans sp. G128 TaxID=2849779 RepID=UPI001C231B28|nr:SAF domain-containing protein [Aquihabitans sp. G128]QXC63265.1 hypothetical protein KSP35_11030 [Aquihabitans sp. G128]
MAALAAATAGLTGRLVAAAQAERERWGETRPVLVADRPLAAGDPLAGAVRTVRWPVGLAPPSALRAVPAGARTAGPVAEGAPLTAASLARGGPGGADRQRLAVPVANARLPLRVGDRVDVWATVDPAVTGAAVATRRVARAATVASAGSRSVVVAVAADEVPEVAEAAALATVTLVATGG